MWQQKRENDGEPVSSFYAALQAEYLFFFWGAPGLKGETTNSLSMVQGLLQVSIHITGEERKPRAEWDGLQERACSLPSRES